MFFIQACQGSKVDDGFKLYARNPRTTRIETDSIGFEPLDMKPILPHNDFLIVYASVPGFYSMRNSEHGSWFVQVLCRELNNRNNVENLDLLKILTFVNQSVAYDFTSNTANIALDQKKQVPCVVSMLTKLVFLQEKYPSNE